MLWLPIDKTKDMSLIQQVYHQIRSYILRGVMKSGDKLPSTRELAAHLNVSRNVILEAYDLLLAEGYLVSRPGSGTYVAKGAFLEQPQSQDTVQAEIISKQDFSKPDLINLRSGLPDLNLLPRKKWSQLEQAIYLDSTSAVFGYDSPEGRIELRQSLSHYLKKTRGVNCRPDQIIVTSGAVQGLSILSQALLTPEKSYIIEDPIHRDICNIFSMNSNRIHPVQVDESGIRTDILPENISPALIMVTPSHQYPLGSILPVQRRIELIQYARAKNCYIIEDDYDSEFRYEGPPINSLQGLDSNRVIYIGTFSKILFPALRIGYMILPAALIGRCRELKHFQDNHTTIMSQLTLARFIAEGYLEKHIAKMKKVYRHKRDLLITNLRKAFPDHLSLSGLSTGLHLIAGFKGIVFSESLIENIAKAGVIVNRVEEHAVDKGFHMDQIIIGYSHLSDQEIVEGVTRLKTALLPFLFINKGVHS